MWKKKREISQLLGDPAGDDSSFAASSPRDNLQQARGTAWPSAMIWLPEGVRWLRTVLWLFLPWSCSLRLCEPPSLEPRVLSKLGFAKEGL